MGTRSDYYIGRGTSAEWLGSMAWDGYPDNPAIAYVLKATSEGDFRARVEALFGEHADQATRPADGWPWPWEDSRTTDYAYAFDAGAAWVSCFGREWQAADGYAETDDEDDGRTMGGDAFPDMSERKNVTLGSRSGLIVLSKGGRRGK